MRLISRTRSAIVRRLIPLAPAAALLLAVLLVLQSSGHALAQGPGVSLVNEDEDFVERKKDGGFVARPIFDRELDHLYYGVRHPDTGDWLTAMYRVRGGERRLREGWEHTFEYPVLDEQPALDPERAYLLVMLVREQGASEPHTFHAIVPVHQPTGLWDRVIGALDPGRWAKAIARWIVEGVHGTLCGVVERAVGVDADECRGG